MQGGFREEYSRGRRQNTGDRRQNIGDGIQETKSCMAPPIAIEEPADFVDALQQGP